LAVFAKPKRMMAAILVILIGGAISSAILILGRGQPVSARTALSDMRLNYTSLIPALRTFGSQLEECNKPKPSLSCLERGEYSMANVYQMYAQNVSKIPVPNNIDARLARQEVVSAATQSAEDLRALSRPRTLTQYRQVLEVSPFLLDGQQSDYASQHFIYLLERMH